MKSSTLIAALETKYPGLELKALRWRDAAATLARHGLIDGELECVIYAFAGRGGGRGARM